MLFFGYIVSDIKYKDLNEDIVKVVSSTDECDKPLPRLIVGLDNAKKYASENGFEFDILNHTYPNGDMWTFKKTEKREMYEDDIEAFKEMIVRIQGNDITYRYIDVFKLKTSEIKRLYNLMLNNTLKRDTNYIIVDKDMVYMALENNTVIGISLAHLRYIGIDKEKVIEKLRAPKYNRVYFTSSKNMWKMKEWFEDREYVIASIFEKNARKKTN